MTNSKHISGPLNNEEFKVALAKGLGRAKLHVENYGLNSVADLVLNACLKDQAYDPQCESSRATWLFSMFDQTSHYHRFRDTILSALEEETETWDLLQLCEIVKVMISNGDENARQLFKNRIFEIASTPSEHDWMGAEEWIELEGLNGFLELARINGQKLRDNPDEFPDDYLLHLDLGDESPKDTLIQYSEKDPLIKVYWQKLESHKAALNKRLQAALADGSMKPRTANVFYDVQPLDSILNNARNCVGQHPGRYSGFGKHATKEQLEEVYNILVNEVNESIAIRLLWVFHRATLPRIDAIIFDWAIGGNIKLRVAAISALSHKQHPQVHELAREKLKSRSIFGVDCGALDLFIHNYETNDAHLIMQAISSSEPNMNEIHSLGGSILDIAEQHGDPALEDLLKWVYEYTPCSNCREKAVQQLDRIQKLDESLLHECMFDSVQDIKDFAKKRYHQMASNAHDAI